MAGKNIKNTTILVLAVAVIIWMATAIIIIILKNPIPRDHRVPFALRYSREYIDFHDIILFVMLLDEPTLHQLAKPGENLNSPAFAALCADFFGEGRNWHEGQRLLMFIFSIEPNGIVDSDGNPVYVTYFPADVVDFREKRLGQLSRVYEIAAWSVGPNGVNDLGGGDDHFVGKRRDCTLGLDWKHPGFGGGLRIVGRGPFSDTWVR